MTSAVAVAVQELRADRLLLPVDLLLLLLLLMLFASCVLLLLLLLFLQGGLFATCFESTNDSQVIINPSEEEGRKS